MGEKVKGTHGGARESTERLERAGARRLRVAQERKRLEDRIGALIDEMMVDGGLSAEEFGVRTREIRFLEIRRGSGIVPWQG